MNFALTYTCMYAFIYWLLRHIHRPVGKNTSGMRLKKVSETPKQRIAALLAGSLLLTAVGHFMHDRVLYDRYRRQEQPAKK